MLGRGIDGADGAVGKADIGMRHHRLRLAGRQIITVGHAHGRILVRNDDRLGQRDLFCRGLRQSFDDRRKIRARIGKDIVHADRFQSREKRAAGGDGCCRCIGHRFVHFRHL